MRDRKTYIGGGDIGAICGVGFRSPFQVWQQKIGDAPDEAPSVHMRVGIALENMILADYEQQHGVVSVEQRQQQFFDDEFDFFGGTIDGIADGVLVDAKYTTKYAFDGDELPAGYQLQAQWYMMLTQCSVAHFHVLHAPAGVFRTYEVARDDVLIDDLRRVACDFWQHVQCRTPPKYTVGDSITQWLAALDKPRDEFWADDDMLEVIRGYKTASEIKNEAAKSAEEYREKILNRMRCTPDVIVDPMTEVVVMRITKRKDGTFHAMKAV